MSRLNDRLKRLIEAGGPIGVDQYMAICLFDPEDGYYTTREPFGAGGDFITAPEISQMFGELLAVWLVSAWVTLGRPAPFALVEIGPGRGTLMADMLRTLGRIAPDMNQAAKFVMVEVSPRLQAIQRQALSGHAVEWVATPDELPDLPLLLVGNEIFDAIPIRQFVKTSEGWRERTVTVGDNTLAFSVGSGSLDESLLPSDSASASVGDIVEIAPARSALMEAIAHRIVSHRGIGLFIDYGYATPAVADTFQALCNHAYVLPLEAPGEADLTAHVDFTALAAVARSHGLATSLRTQSNFLLAMGLLERAGSLGASLDQAGRDRIGGEVERLAGPDQMGTLFKALAIGSAKALPHPFGTAD